MFFLYRKYPNRPETHNKNIFNRKTKQQKLKTNGKSREPNGRKKSKTNGELYELNEFNGPPPLPRLPKKKQPFFCYFRISLYLCSRNKRGNDGQKSP